MTPDELERAACRGMDPDIFHPSSKASKGMAAQMQLTAQAKRICAGCEVIDACRESNSKEPIGVWFGTSGRERTGRTTPKVSARDMVIEAIRGRTRWFTSAQAQDMARLGSVVVRTTLVNLAGEGKLEKRIVEGRAYYRWAA